VHFQTHLLQKGIEIIDYNKLSGAYYFCIYLIVLAKLIFHLSELSQFTGKFKSCEQGILRGEHNQGRTGQRLVRVDTRQGVTQRIRLTRF
jgi:hypothetical protein